MFAILNDALYHINLTLTLIYRPQNIPADIPLAIFSSTVKLSFLTTKGRHAIFLFFKYK